MKDLTLEARLFDLRPDVHGSQQIVQVLVDNFCHDLDHAAALREVPDCIKVNVDAILLRLLPELTKRVRLGLVGDELRRLDALLFHIEDGKVDQGVQAWTGIGV